MTKKKMTPEEEDQTTAEQIPETDENAAFAEDALPEYLNDDMGLREPPLPEDQATFDESPPPEETAEDAVMADALSECEILSAEAEPIRREETDDYALIGAEPVHPEDEAMEPPIFEQAATEVMPTPPVPLERAETVAVPPKRKDGGGRSSLNSGDDRRAFYQLDFHDLDRGLSPEEQQEWNAIYASFRGRSVLTGTVVGIDLHAIRVRDKDSGELRRQEMYCAIVIPFRVRILIPETEMWPKGEERPGFVLRNIVGAKLDVVIIHVDREAGFAIGSRRMAMGSRQYYFSNRPNLNKPGTRVKCGVLAVGPRRCLITCHGYDVNLTQREMRYTAIPDLRNAYHPGDELDCIVKAYDREQGQLTVSVKETQPNPFDGAQLRHPIGSRRQAVIAGKYAGGVFCNLPDGAVCMCSYSYHYEDGEFAVGDKVILTPQRYENEKKQIYGKIVAKW